MNFNRLSLRSFFVLIPLALAIPMPSAAQEGAAEFFDAVNVRVINLEVFVRDGEQHPITGLDSEDFEILVDGEPVEISNFHRVDAQARDSGQASAPAPMATAAEAPVEDTSEVPAQPLSVVLFIDNFHLAARNRDRVLELLRTTPWFDAAPGRQILVVVHNGTGSLEVAQPFTDDPVVLEATLSTLDLGSGGGGHLVAEYLGMARQIASIGAGGGVDDTTRSEATDVMSGLRIISEREYAGIQETLAVLERFIGSLAGLPGRKALLYISDGLPLRPGESMLEAFGNFVGGAATGLGMNMLDDSSEHDTTPLWHTLGQRANANGVTFYTVLAGGDRGLDLQPLESAFAFGTNRFWSERAKALETSNLQAPMELIAEATGGMAFLHPKNLARDLESLRQDLSSYYSLGYSLETRADGADHDVVVRLKNPPKGSSVRHRASFRDKTSQAAMSDRTLATLFFEGAESNPHGIRIELGESQPQGDDHYLVPVTVKVPIERLLLLPDENYHQGSLSLFVGARDAQGHLSPIQHLPTPIRIPNQKLLVALGQVASYNMGLMLRSGEHTVVVGFRDEVANTESLTRMRHNAAP